MTSLAENTSTASRIKVADITVTDDGPWRELPRSLAGADARVFSRSTARPFISRLGTVLDYEAQNSYDVTVRVDDPTVGSSPDATTTFALTLTDVNEAPFVIDLTTLSSAEGFIIQGDAAGDEAGYSVSSAGDVNGDGFDDLIVGAPYGDDGRVSAGEAYVVFGSNIGFGTTDGTGRQVLDLTTLSPAEGFIIQGDVAGDQAGYSVSSAGDVNGDGF